MAERVPKLGETSEINIINLFNNPDFVRDLSNLNMFLNAYMSGEGTSTSEQDLEDEKIEEFTARWFGLGGLNRPISLRGITYSEPDEDSDSKVSLHLNYVTNAKFIGIKPEHYQDDCVMSREEACVIGAVAYRLASLYLDTPEYYMSIPLSRENILEATLQVPTPPIARGASVQRLNYYAEIYYNILTSEAVRQMPIKLQMQQAQEFADIMNDEQRQNRTSNVHIITSKSINGRQIVTHAATDYELVPLTAGSERTIRRNKGLLGLKITHVGGGEVTIPYHTVLDIQPYNEYANSSEDRFGDMRHVFADSTLQQQITDAENWINNLVDDNDITASIGECIEDTNNAYPQYDEYTYDYAGTVYYEDPETHELTPLKIDVVNANSYGFDMQNINGNWRATFTLELQDYELPNIQLPGTHTSATCHILPYSGDARQFWQNSIEDIEDDDLLKTCAQVADETVKLIQSKKFRRSNARQKTAMVDEKLLPLISMVNRVASDSELNSTVVADEYYVIDSRITEFTCADISRFCFTDTKLRGEPEGRSIDGKIVAVFVPELHDKNTSTPQTINNFPLSGGKPMIVLEDEANNLVYFIPALNIKYLAQFAPGEQPED